MRSYQVVLPCVLLFACSAPESDNRSLRCSPTLSCPDELICYRGFCVDDGLDPSTGGPVGNEPTVDVADGGTSLVDNAATGSADAGAGNVANGGGAAPAVGSPSSAGDASSASTGTQGSTASGSTAPGSSSSGSTSSGSSGSGSSGPGPVTAGGTTGSSAPGVDASVGVTPSSPGPLDAGALPAPAVDAAAAPVTPTTPVQTPTTPPTQTPTTPPTTPGMPPPQTPGPTTPATDAGAAGEPCAAPCSSASYDEKKCNQCVKDTYGESPAKLCGDGKGEPLLSLTLDPICVSLCLGAARNSPTCIGLFSKHGPALGGEQP